MDVSRYFRPEIAAMAGYVPGEQPQEGKFIKLNTNENPYPPSAAVVRAIQEASQHKLTRYPDPQGTVFRRRAGEVLGVDPDGILCGNGSDDILTIVTRALVGAGQVMRTPYPSYILYRTLAQLQGAICEEVSFESDWSLPPRFAAATESLRLVVLPNPNSPSGTLVPPDVILRMAEQLPCPLLVDEAYVDFSETSCLSLVARCERLMVSRSFSKSYALAGLRFGFLVAQPDLVTQFEKVKDSYNCDALAIAGATAAIDDQDWLQSTQTRLRRTREESAVALRQLGFSVQPSQANFLWCTRTDRPLKPVYEQLKSAQILVRYMQYPQWGDGLRVSIGTDAQMDALLTVLRRIL